MTNPVSNKVQAEVYVQGNAGAVRNPAGESFSNIGTTLGGEVNYKGTYLKAEAGAGTALSGKLEVGHEFDIGKNMGLDLSAKVQTATSTKTNEFNHDFTTHANGNIKTETGDIPFDIKSGDAVVAQWHSGEARLGGAAELTFKSKNAKFGVGLEAGVRQSTAHDVNWNFEHNYSIGVSYEGEEYSNTIQHRDRGSLDLYKQSGYITPTVSAEVKLGKNSPFSFTANADLYQGQAGIKYTF